MLLSDCDTTVTLVLFFLEGSFSVINSGGDLRLLLLIMTFTSLYCWFMLWWMDVFNTSAHTFLFESCFVYFSFCKGIYFVTPSGQVKYSNMDTHRASFSCTLSEFVSVGGRRYCKPCLLRAILNNQSFGWFRPLCFDLVAFMKVEWRLGAGSTNMRDTWAVLKCSLAKLLRKIKEKLVDIDIWYLGKVLLTLTLTWQVCQQLS